MTAEIIKDKSLWDKFVDTSPYGMLFHKWDLLKIVERHTGQELRTYGFFKGDELIGVMPLFYKKTKGVKMIYSPPQGSLAYIPYMGMVMGESYPGLKQRKKESYLDMAWSDLNNELKHVSPNFTSITFVPEMYDIRPLLWDGYDVELRYTYIIDLQKPLETIWDGFEKECRKNIKDCEPYDLRIKQTTDIDSFYRTMATDLDGHGSNNTFFQRQSPEYLKELIKAFPQNIKLYSLYRDNEVIGANVNCEYKDLCMGWEGDAVMQREIKSNEYLNWELIKMAKESGYKRYENWGADMKRLNQFKSKFNPTLVPYYHVRKKDTVGRLSEWGYGMISGNAYLGFMKKIVS